MLIKVMFHSAFLCSRDDHSVIQVQITMEGVCMCLWVGGGSGCPTHLHTVLPYPPASQSAWPSG